MFEVQGETLVVTSSRCHNFKVNDVKDIEKNTIPKHFL